MAHLVQEVPESLVDLGLHFRLSVRLQERRLDLVVQGVLVDPPVLLHLVDRQVQHYPLHLSLPEVQEDQLAQYYQWDQEVLLDPHLQQVLLDQVDLAHLGFLLLQPIRVDLEDQGNQCLLVHLWVLQDPLLLVDQLVLWDLEDQ